MSPNETNLEDERGTKAVSFIPRNGRVNPPTLSHISCVHCGGSASKPSSHLWIHRWPAGKKDPGGWQSVCGDFRLAEESFFRENRIKDTDAFM